MNRACFCIPAALLVVAVSSVTSLLWSSAFAQDAGKGKVTAIHHKWEYKVVRESTDPNTSEVDTKKFETAVNRLGEEGWECVGTVSEVRGGGPGRANSTDAVLIFKRPNKS